MFMVEDKTISIKRTFNSSLNEVRKAWIEDESFKKWWGLKDYTCSYYSLKKIIYTNSMTDNNKIVSVSEYEIPKEWESDLLITIEFEETDGKTNLLLKHEGIPQEIYEECMKGWEECLKKLEENFK